MSDLLYDFLGLFGYSHPVHPVLVHMPTGLSMGAFCMVIWAKFARQSALLTTAYQMVVLAFVFVFLAIPVGIFDWQRFYGGAWIFEIKMKLGLAAFYVIMLSFALWKGRRHHDAAILPVFYLGALLAVMGLGFFGGQLVYRGFSPEAPRQYAEGRHIFESHCSGCHRRGENIIVPNLPLRNAPQLQNFKEFIGFIRNPKMPDGTPGLMPIFTSKKLSDDKAKQLYEYLFFAFMTPNRPVSIENPDTVRP